MYCNVSLFVVKCVYVVAVFNLGLVAACAGIAVNENSVVRTVYIGIGYYTILNYLCTSGFCYLVQNS